MHPLARIDYSRGESLTVVTSRTSERSTQVEGQAQESSRSPMPNDLAGCENGRVISIDELSVAFGRTQVLDRLTFDVRPGEVTGFLGPNGAGKSTTMNAILGLVRPSNGTATIDGRRYVDLAEPMVHVGALLDDAAPHGDLTARRHLAWLAATHGLDAGRANTALAVVGLAENANQRVRSYSLGMRKRLGLAAALLGDPKTLILDEPTNGLDPEGIRWIRELLKGLADEGRTVFLSSHLLGEMTLIADRLVMIDRGKLIGQYTPEALAEKYSTASNRIRVSDPPTFISRLEQEHHRFQVDPDGSILVAGMTLHELSQIAEGAGTDIYDVSTERPPLEDIFLQLVDDARRGG